MQPKDRVNRYADLVALEIKNHNLRMPIWTQAMIVTKGDVKAAEDIYITMRVQQMEQDEVNQELLRDTKVTRDKKDVPPSRLLSKTFLLLLGFLVAAICFALFFFFVMGTPHVAPVK